MSRDCLSRHYCPHSKIDTVETLKLSTIFIFGNFWLTDFNRFFDFFGSKTMENWLQPIPQIVVDEIGSTKYTRYPDSQANFGNPTGQSPDSEHVGIRDPDTKVRIPRHSNCQN